ncbi:MAG: M15 family metallopeptidase [Defluviitaleaceae bacterium]|nr:M15 family metallopeptidase [Defluviitaleaceae bacterium]
MRKASYLYNCMIRYAYTIRVACLTAAALIFCVLTTVQVHANDGAGLLWLVNTDHPLCEGFEPRTLVDVGNHRMDGKVADAYEKLTAAMQAEKAEAGDQTLYLYSAYRSYGRQKDLFAERIRHYITQGYSRKEARERAAQSVQPPGASEHQTGLALDVSSTGALNQAFGETPAGEWLAANAHRFGFIIRYPQSKTHTTNIIYEPWHLRYVGTPHAEIMHARDLALEEYADFLAAHTPFIFQNAAGEFQSVTICDKLPDEWPPDAINISATHYGQGARYIVTYTITTHTQIFTFP